MNALLARTWPLLLVTLLVSTGCVEKDFGTPCTLKRPIAGGGSEDFIPDNDSLDYIAMGVPDCEDFTCVDTAGDTESGGGMAGAYCSRRCLEDAQCRGGADETLVCRPLNLDPVFIENLRARLGDDEFYRIFGDITYASFCARPEPE